MLFTSRDDIAKDAPRVKRLAEEKFGMRMHVKVLMQTTHTFGYAYVDYTHSRRGARIAGLQVCGHEPSERGASCSRQRG